MNEQDNSYIEDLTNRLKQDEGSNKPLTESELENYDNKSDHVVRATQSFEDTND